MYNWPRTAALSLFGLLAGIAAGIPAASIYLNLAAGLGVNEGQPFSFVTEFPGFDALSAGPWAIAVRIIAAAALAFAVLAFLMSIRQELTEYGQSRFQTKRELAKAGLLRPIGEGLVFAKLGRPDKKKRPYVSARYDKFPHCLVVAPTRAGKGVGYVIPNMLLFPGSTVVLDVKGEIFEATARHRLAQGDHVFRFAPFDFDRPSHRYNPLERVAKIPHPDRRYTELAKIADYFLTVSDKGSAGDFLTEGRELFVAAGLLAIERERATIGEITRILFGSGATQEQYKAMAAEVVHPSARRSFTKFAGYSERTLSSHASVLSGAGLTLWNNPAVDKATAANDFSFGDLRKRPQSVYLVVNADDIKTLAPLIRLFFGELIATLRATLPDKKSEPWPVMVMLDEFDQLGPMPIVEQALKQLAGHGARVSIITQSIPGLDNIYGENIRLSLESAAGMKLFLSPNEKKTAAEVSEGLGKTTKLSVSDSLSRDTGLRAKRSISRRMEERPLLSPDEIKRLSPMKVILLPERQNPIMAERIVYYEDPTFRALIDKQTGALPYPPVEIAEIAALRAEVAELREQFGAIRHRARPKGLAVGMVEEPAFTQERETTAEPARTGPASAANASVKEPIPTEGSATEDQDDDLFAAFAGEIVADLQSFEKVVDAHRQTEAVTHAAQRAEAL